MEPLASPPPPGRLFRLASGFYLLLALAGGAWIGVREGPIPLALFIGGADRADLALDLLVGLACGALLIALWQLAHRFLALARELEEGLARALGPLTLAEIVALALISGFAEELFFRGAVLRAFGPVAAVIGFAALHTGPGRAYRLWTLFAALAGAAFAALVVWRGNLLSAITAHALVNAVNLRALTLRFRGTLATPTSN